MKAETTTVLLPVTVFEASADKDIEFESTLADYLPNINRIIRADADLICEDVQINGNKGEIRGKAVFTLLYESDFKQKLRCERFNTDFTQRFDLRELPEGELYPKAKLVCSYVGCKTLNPRRFILRCRSDVQLEIRAMQKVKVVSTEDCKGAFFKTESVKTAVYTPDIIRDFKGEESVSLDTLPPIGEIIYTSISFSAPEISQSEGSALIRAELLFKCMYESENEENTPQMFCRRLPAVFTVDDENITAESELCLTLSATHFDAVPDIDAYGEKRIIRLNYGARACMACLYRREINVPTDMFFEEYTVESKTQSFVFEEPEKDIRHRFSLDRMFDGEELYLDTCTDANADATVTETLITEEGISVKGNCTVSVLGLEGGVYRAKDANIPFSELIPFNAAGTVKATAEAGNPVAEMIGGRLSVRVPVTLSLSVTHKESISAISSAEIEKRTDSEKDEKPVIIYFPEKGESAWSIGKRYYVDPKKVMESNENAFDKDGVVTEKDTMLYM